MHLTNPATNRGKLSALKALASKWWYEPSSFFLFESDSDINAVASAIADSVDQAVDLVLVGMPDFKSARVVGRVEDDDLFSLMPFTKKA